MRVVAYVHGYPPELNAGAEWMLNSLLRALTVAGHDCAVVLTEGRQRRGIYRWGGVTVFPAGSIDDERPVRDADVVITHLSAAPRAISLAERFGKPLVQLMHNDFGDTTRHEIEGRTALYVYNSCWLRDSLGDRQPGIVCRPPVYAEDYRTTPGDKVTLINLAAIKGGDVFWSLVARMPDVEFLGVRGGYARQVVLDYPNATVIPNTTDMRAVYGQTRILLMPSEYESWGRAAVEAMCSGIPVIATDHDGPRESIGDAGILLPRMDLDAWEAAIRNLLRPQVYEVASARARARADALDPTDDLARFVAAVEAVHAGAPV